MMATKDNEARRGLTRLASLGLAAAACLAGIALAQGDRPIRLAATPEVRETMAKQDNTINVSTPEFAAQFFPAELAKYAAIVKKIGLEPQ